ncbi:SPT2 chromatin protein-domain-containing protein [Phakopsora pachyrhizi]|uniref:SPT2 chromatin protein-domain-containing protein n=1 Tax=Phakopsora pachyrhizi TaxID=170000 RepID=A0AAV0B2B8_PHAPC|nr:SPT2 chromatin protein-domain-containing protein [Phakopsora pachyrhizi]CAH7676434.1 SPT2 chromatin protein-domain-containing protein [Phakopsora pachyrhizi]
MQSRFDALMALASKQTAASQTALAKENQLRQAREKARRLEEERKEKERIRLEKERLMRQKLEDDKREKRHAEELARRQAERAALADQRKREENNSNNNTNNNSSSLPKQSGSRTLRRSDPNSNSNSKREGRNNPSISSTKDPEELRRINREEKQAKIRAKLFGEPLSAHKKAISSSSTAGGNHQRRNPHNQPASRLSHSKTFIGKGNSHMVNSRQTISSGLVTARQRVQQQMSIEGIQPLNRVKRDRRTIEEVERDMKRRKEDLSFKSETQLQSSSSLNPRPGSLRNNSQSPRQRDQGTAGSRPRPRPPLKRTIDQDHREKVRGKSVSETMMRGGISMGSKRNLPSNNFSHEEDYDSEEEEEGLDEPDHVPGSMRDEIWKIMGKDRREYASRPIISDEEDSDDMEADLDDVFEEEGRAAKLARIEDQREQEALRRHEQEKKKRLAELRSGSLPKQ